MPAASLLNSQGEKKNYGISCPGTAQFCADSDGGIGVWSKRTLSAKRQHLSTGRTLASEGIRAEAPGVADSCLILRDGASPTSATGGVANA